MYYEDGFLPDLSDQEEVCCRNILVNASDGYHTNDGIDFLLASLDRKEPNSLFSGNKFVDTLCKLPKLKLLEDQLKENGLESSDEESCVLQRPSDRVPSEEASRPPSKVPLLRNPEGLRLPPPRLGPFQTHDNGLFPEPCLPPRPANFDHRPINEGLLPEHRPFPRFLAPHEQHSMNNNRLLDPGLPPRPPLAPHEQEQLSMNNNLLLDQGPLRNPPFSPVEQRAVNNGMETNFSPGNPNHNGFHDHQNQQPFKFNHRGRSRNLHPNRDRGFRYGNNFNNNRMNGDHPNHQSDRSNFDRNFDSRPNRTRMHPFENQQNDERAVNGRGNFNKQRGPKYFRSVNNGHREPAFGQPKFQRGEQQFNRGRHFRGRRR